MENKYSLEKAQKFIDENKNKTNKKYRHEFHLMPEVGWMNDPNGFSYYDSLYHLFYQYYPYDSVWGPMHWAHATTSDFITWEHLPVALAPDGEFDYLGCFSGNAIEHDGKHYLFYTGIVTDDIEQKNTSQRQCLAIGDGRSYIKYDKNPIIDEKQLPKNILSQDFRDPKVFKYGDLFYCILGSKTDEQKGCFILFESENLIDWTYKSILNQSNEINGGVYECPDYFQLSKKDILLLSPQFKRARLYEHYNYHSTMYKIGKLDFKSGKFESEFESEIDFGFDFYAPQTLIDENGRRIMIAWMQMWERNMPSNTHKHGWAGAMTIPRVLSIVDDKFYQYPVEEINNYRTDEFKLDFEFCGEFTHKSFSGNKLDLDFTFKFDNDAIFGVKLFKGEDEETVFTFDTREQTVTLDRSKSGIKIQGNKFEMSNCNVRKTNITLNNKIKTRFILDNTSIEAFFNYGERAMTTNVYPSELSDKIMFFSDSMIKVYAEKYTLGRKNPKQ